MIKLACFVCKLVFCDLLVNIKLDDINTQEMISPIMSPITAISRLVLVIIQKEENTYTILTLIICSINCVIEGMLVFLIA